MLNRDEVFQVLRHVRTFHDYVFLMTVYTCGLRLQDFRQFHSGDQPVSGENLAARDSQLAVTVEKGQVNRGFITDVFSGDPGWINYYCRFYGSAFKTVTDRLNMALMRWALRKFKQIRGHKRRAIHWLGRIAARNPRLFPHWKAGIVTSTGTMGAG